MSTLVCQLSSVCNTKILADRRANRAPVAEGQLGRLCEVLLVQDFYERRTHLSTVTARGGMDGARVVYRA